MAGTRSAAILIVKSQRGIALVIVLWTITLLSVFAAGMSHSMRQDTRLTSNYVENARLTSLAEGGIYHGIQRLLDSDQDNQWSRDGIEYEVMLDNHRLHVSLQDERGKIDLNQSPEALLLHVIERGDFDVDATAIVHAILDWRDKDQARHDAGAEDDDYLQSQYHYGARDNPFLSVAELQQVMGMTASLYNELAGLFTVYSGGNGIDPSTVPVDVLSRMPGMDNETAWEFVTSRQQAAGNNIASAVLPTEVQPFLSKTGPNIYTITSRVQSPEGTSVVASAIVHLTGQKNNAYTVVAWRYPIQSVVEY